MIKTEKIMFKNQKTIDGGFILSNDDSTYVPQKPKPPPEPYVHSLDEGRKVKVDESGRIAGGAENRVKGPIWSNI